MPQLAHETQNHNVSSLSDRACSRDQSGRRTDRAHLAPAHLSRQHRHDLDRRGLRSDLWHDPQCAQRACPRHDFRYLFAVLCAGRHLVWLFDRSGMAEKKRQALVDLCGSPDRDHSQLTGQLADHRWIIWRHHLIRLQRHRAASGQDTAGTDPQLLHRTSMHRLP